MRGLISLIVLLLIIGGIMWYYSKFISATTGRTVSAVTQTGVTKPAAAQAQATATATQAPEKKRSTSRQSGDSLRNTGIGKRIKNIYSTHNKAVNDASK